jgi:5-formyltetrahydrofolate cyclo-ligase
MSRQPHNAFFVIRSEPDLSPLLKEILKDGKHAYLPVVVKGDKKFCL